MVGIWSCITFNRHMGGQAMNKKRTLAFLGAMLSSVVFGGVLLFLVFSYQMSDNIDELDSKGDAAFAEKNYNAAINYWMTASEKAEDQGHFYVKIGDAFLKLSNLDQAETYLEKALKKEPLSQDIQKQIIRIALLKGDGVKAKMVLTKLLTGSGQDDPDVLVLSGDYFMLTEEFEQAETSYRKTIEHAPGDIRPKLKLAICLVQQKRDSEAKIILDDIQVDQIQSPDDLMLLADYLVLTELYDTAKKVILLAIDGDPENISFKIDLCRLYRSAGMADELTQYLSTLVTQYPDRPEFKLILADISLSGLDLNSAEKWLTASEKIKDVQTNYPGYHLLMGKLWLFKNRYSHAVSYLKTALELNYGLASAHYLLGVAYFAGGQTKLAENEMIQTLSIAPAHVDAHLALAGIYYKKREYPLTYQYIDRILSLDPSNSRSWKLKGLCYLEEKKYNLASQAFAKAWQFDGHDSSLFFLGKAFEGLGLEDEAKDSYVSVLESSPDLMEALFQYVMFMADTGRESEAFETIDQRIRGEEAHPGIYYIGAQLSLSVGDYERCQAYLDRGMETKPTPGFFYLLMADLQRAKENEQGIEAALSACTRENPRFLNGWLKLSGYYVEKQDTDRAMETLEQAIRFFPDDPRVMGNLSWLLLENETDFDRAFELARDAYELLPGKAWIMDTLGWAYYHKGIYSQAEWLLAQAEERAPDMGLIRYHQGMVMYRRGRLADAKEKLLSALTSEDLSTANRESVKSVLDGLKETSGIGGKGEKQVFNPDAGSELDITEMPAVPEEDGDILQPDWSKLK